MKSFDNNIEVDFVEASQPAEKGEPYLSPEEMPDFLEKTIKENPGVYEDWLRTAAFWRNAFLFARIRARYEAEDILNILFEKLFLGDRKWYYKKYPDFQIFIKMSVKCVTHDIFRLEKKRCEKEYLSEENVNPSVWDDVTEEEIEDRLEDNNFEKFVKMALDVLSREDSDVEEGTVFLCIYEGNTENRNIASELGMQVKDVVNAKKRLKRKLIGLYSQFYHGKENN